jgi:D-glycero-alpha-D-manno-heptose-7-phosphate kinase
MTPLRFSMGGGGTDVPAYYENDQEGGFWTAATVNLYVRVTANLRIDNFYVIKYSTATERVEAVDEIDNDHIRCTLKIMKMDTWNHPEYGTRGLEINIISDVQSRSGLGVSSAMVVGLLQILHQVKGETGIDLAGLAEEAYHIEHNLVGDQSTGKQDQYAAAIGGIKSFEVDRSGHVRIIDLPMDAHTRAELEGNLILFGTQLKREMTANQSIQLALESNPSSYHDFLTQIKEIGREQRRSILAGNLDKFGDLMDAHWEVKKKYGGAPDEKVEEAYVEAKKAGALGGKVIGAATQGGYMIYYCPSAGKMALRTIMQKLGMIEIPWKFIYSGSKIIHID